jgi:hypothetical protein
MTTTRHPTVERLRSLVPDETDRREIHRLRGWLEYAADGILRANTYGAKTAHQIRGIVGDAQDLSDEMIGTLYALRSNLVLARDHRDSPDHRRGCAVCAKVEDEYLVSLLVMAHEAWEQGVTAGPGPWIQ